MTGISEAFRSPHRGEGQPLPKKDVRMQLRDSQQMSRVEEYENSR